MQDISRLVYELKSGIIHMNQRKRARGVRAESRNVSMERTAAMTLHHCLSVRNYYFDQCDWKDTH
jgi:hypothetical protein